MTPTRGSTTSRERVGAPAVLGLATQLTLAGDEVEVSRMVADFARDQLGLDRVSVVLLHPDDPRRADIVALSGAAGELPRGTEVRVADLAIGEALSSHQPFTYRPSERPEKDARALVEMGISLAVIVPLLSGNRCLGTLNTGSVDGNIDTDTVSQLARLLGSQLDRIAAHSALEQQLKSQQTESRRWELLSGLERWAVNAVTVDEVVSNVADIVSELIAEPHLSFVEMRTGSALIRLADGQRRETFIELDDPRHAALLERFGSDAAHYLPDLDAEPVQPFAPELLADGAKSVLCVAVHGRTAPLGALIISSTERDGIAPRDQEMLNAIAPLVGGALERLEVDERLARAATHDQLTGLIRRTGFDAIVEDEVESLRSSDRSSAVVAIDVDRFKVVNDTEGHLRGDDFLVELVVRLGRVLEPQDVATRIGADEFMVLLRGRDRDEYENVCGRLVSAVNTDPFIVGDRSLLGSISLGFVTMDGHTESAREAMSMADAACYSAKMVGGNRAKPALANDSRQSARRTASQSLVQLRRAIEEDSLTLLGQPIYELGNGELSGFEVLVRMWGPNGELISPGNFLPIAERFHATEDLDLWVLRRALKRLSRCSADAGELPRLFINLSPSSITSAGFFERVEELVSDSRVSADRLCFEITETGTMKSFEEAAMFIERVKELGSLVALDDFGVGLSSLSHLYRLPVDVLKIDGSLVQGIETSTINATMVATIQALAEALGKITIAEFVENDQAARRLRRVGVHCGQGFYLGRPEPLCDQLSNAGFAPVD